MSSSSTASVDAVSVHAKECYGVNELHDFQRQAISAVLRGKDVVVRAATGAGKSLCFQLPATIGLLGAGTVLVVSPLLALMRDQTNALARRGIPALYIASDRVFSSDDEAKLSAGEFRLVYMSPEGAATARNVDLMRRVPSLLLVAIDEAHCVSTWGHDFRPAYRDLSELRGRLAPADGRIVPIIALTATATPSVLDDIASTLRMRGDQTVVIKTPLDRPNLRFSIFVKQNAALDMKALVDAGVLRNDGKWSALIYCPSRAVTEQLTRIVVLLGIRAAAYHAGLTSEDRARIVSMFCAGNDEPQTLDVVIATVAFGMGIDKSDIRAVVNYGVAKSLQDYYQQVGRAGRDGKPANCLLFYTAKDFSEAEYSIRNVSPDLQLMKRRLLDGMRKYAQTTSVCRRKMLVEYFGDTAPERCGNCDACDKPASEMIDVTESARILLGVVKDLGERYGATFPVKVLTGSMAREVESRGAHRSAFHGRGRHYSRPWWMQLIHQLREFGYVVDEMRDKFTLLKLSAQGHAWLDAGSEAASVRVPVTAILLRECGLDGKPTAISKLPVASRSAHGVSAFDASQLSERKRKLPPTAKSVHVFTPLDTHLSELFGMLMGLRARIARERNCAPYAVWTESAMRECAQRRPASIEVLRSIDSWKSATDLQPVIDCVRAFVAKLGNLPMTETPLEEAAAASTPPGDDPHLRTVSTPKSNMIAHDAELPAEKRARLENDNSNDNDGDATESMSDEQFGQRVVTDAVDEQDAGADVNGDGIDDEVLPPIEIDPLQREFEEYLHFFSSVRAAARNSETD